MKNKSKKDLTKFAELLIRLKEEKVITSSRFTGDIGEYLVKEKFKLKRPTKSQKISCDFIRGRKKIQVKTRTSIFNENPKVIGVFDMNKLKFDVCWRVVLDKNFQLKEVWEIPLSVVKKQLMLCKDKKRFYFSKNVESQSRKLFPKSKIQQLKN